MLQQSLLPTRLPAVEGLEFASRFVPAEDFGVGGDWFDAFRLPDGGIGVVMGDVAGAGLRAAIVMGRLRSSLRAYAIESASPGEALERVDRKFAHFEPDELATILYVVVSPELSQLTVASRGHPHRCIATPGRDTAVVHCSPRPPIGAHVPAPAMNVTCELPVGSTVACYTDGLIERSGEPIDVGLERLRRVLHAGPPDEVCASVMAQLVGSRPGRGRHGAAGVPSEGVITRPRAQPSNPNAATERDPHAGELRFVEGGSASGRRSRARCGSPERGEGWELLDYDPIGAGHVAQEQVMAVGNHARWPP